MDDDSFVCSEAILSRVIRLRGLLPLRMYGSLNTKRQITRSPIARLLMILRQFVRVKLKLETKRMPKRAVVAP